MANTLIPIEERNLTPDEVEALDARRRRGHLLLTICLQTTVISFLLLLWSGQDATLTAGWLKPMVFWNVVTFCIAFGTGLAGLRLSRGRNEFFSY
jgi:peptidoglycan/LPS O-acetylase OafA/YrhL